MFGEVTDTRKAIPKAELDQLKLETFDQILAMSHQYYETYYTIDGVEHDFDARAFGESVEEAIVPFNQLKPEEDNT